MGESKDNVQLVKLSNACRICHDCGKYIYYGEQCVKETTSGSRRWHHVECWKEGNKKNSNFIKVRTKTNRCCCHCGSPLPKGTECITLNKQSKGGQWLCLDCYDLVMGIKQLDSVCNGISFDDEGASFYFNGELADAVEGFRCRRKK